MLRWWRRFRERFVDAAVEDRAPPPPAESLPADPYRTHVFVEPVPDPKRCQDCNGEFSRWRYACGVHVLCWQCATSNRHRCTVCRRMLVPRVSPPVSD